MTVTTPTVPMTGQGPRWVPTAVSTSPVGPTPVGTTPVGPAGGRSSVGRAPADGPAVAPGGATSGAAPAPPRVGPRDLVRLTVTTQGRRRDLVLPAHVPVGELVPDVASLLGSLTIGASGGWTLVGSGARPLDPEVGLLAQGVDDGTVLTLVSTGELRDLAAHCGGVLPGRVGLTSDEVHDDVVEALAHEVSALGPRWGGAATRVATRVAAGLLSLLALVGVVLQTVGEPSGPVAPGGAAAVATLLLLVGSILGRVRQDVGTAVAVLLCAAPYAALAGLGVGSGDRFGWPLLGAGVALVTVALLSPVALGRAHWLLQSPLVPGLVAMIMGAAHALVHVDPAATAAVLVVATSVLSRLVPWLGITSGGTALVAGLREGPVARTPVRRSAERAHDLVLGVGVGAGVVATAGAPLLAGLGMPGLGIVLVTGVLAVLRTRQLVLRPDVVVGLASGGATLVSGTVSALVVHRDWAPWLTAAVLVAALLTLAALVSPPGPGARRPGARRAQVLELAEGLALGAMLPLLVVVVGLVSAVRAVRG